MKHEMKHRGFTLVELLIVIVVIGVLSAMMMLSSTEAVSSAKASNIVSNLRNLKTAALAWYADHLDDAATLTGDATATTTNLNSKRTDIFKYLNNNTSGENEDTNLSGYSFVGTKDDDTWYVYYNGSDLTDSVKAKLAGRAESVGLYKDATTGHTTTNKYVATATNGVYMWIR